MNTKQTGNMIQHILTVEQARRLNVPVQVVNVILRTDRELPESLHGKRMAKDVYTLNGKRIGGTLSLDS